MLLMVLYRILMKNIILGVFAHPPKRESKTEYTNYSLGKIILGWEFNIYY